MISAREARKRTNIVRNGNSTKEFNRIGQEIEAAVGRGEDSITLDRTISEQTVGCMRSLGYEVYISDQENVAYFTIKW